MNITLKLDAELATKLEALVASRTTSREDTIAAAFTTGVTQLIYRSVSQKRRNAEVKSAMEVLRRAQADPELAVVLGLATRS